MENPCQAQSIRQQHLNPHLCSVCAMLRRQVFLCFLHSWNVTHLLLSHFILFLLLSYFHAPPFQKIVLALELAGRLMDELASGAGPRSDLVVTQCQEFMQSVKVPSLPLFFNSINSQLFFCIHVKQTASLLFSCLMCSNEHHKSYVG